MSSELRNISKEEWDNLLIVFDTSALCKMYDMTDSAKHTMISVLEYLKDKIFIPGHVLAEYHKNRIKVIYNPLQEKYNIPACFKNTALKEEGKKFIDRLGKGNYYHPFILEGAFKIASEKLNEVIEDLSRINTLLTDEFENRRTEISRLVNHDEIKDMVAKLNNGQDYSFDTMMKLCEEGEFRYRNSLPPGYMDSKKINGKCKLGLDIYGDLFVWKQIIDQAKAEQKNVLFLCNDTKEDWWEDYKNKQLRRELTKEFEDKTDKSIYATSLEGFIEELEVRYKDDATLHFYEGLEAVKDVLDYYSHFTSPRMTEDDVYAMLKCKECGHVNRIVLDDLDFYWDEDSWSERDMGTEFGYSTSQYFTCRNCREKIDLNFYLTEYPAGRIETYDIEEEGCEIVNNPNWKRVIEPSFDREAHKCLYCGRWVHELTNDMCEECLDEFNHKIEKD